MSSSTVSCGEIPGNAALCEKDGQHTQAQWSPEAPLHTERGYNFGTGMQRDGKGPAAPSLPPEPLPALGFELLDAGDVAVAWFACVLDACDGLKAHRGPGKVVRVADRALMKIRHPRRVKL